MKLSSVVSGVTLGVGLGAFGLTGALSLRAGVEPLYAVARSIAVFVAVVWVARLSAAALDRLGPLSAEEEQPPLGRGDDRTLRGDRTGDQNSRKI